MVNGILSSHETTVIVSLTDPNSEKSLARLAELFNHNFREDASRVRAIFALRTLLGLELTQSGSSSLPTSPEVIAMLYLLHLAATTDVSTKPVGESKDFAAAALYEHLLRVEDLLRDDSLQYEQRKYRATAAVGGNKGKDMAHDAIEKDAFRGHLLQKVFVVQCALLLPQKANLSSSNSSSNAANGATLLVDDLTQTVGTLCAATNASSSLDNLENVVAAWATEATLKTLVTEALAHLKKCYDREVVQHSSSVNIVGSSQGNNFMAVGALNRAVPMPSTECNPVATANGFLNNGFALTQAKKGSKHFYTGGDIPTVASYENVLAPISAIVNPPRGRVAVDARLLLPPSNPLVLDAVAHPQDWREGKSMIDSAIAGTELTAPQIAKLTALLSEENSSAAGASSSSAGTNGKKTAAVPATANNNTSTKKNGKDSTGSNSLVPTDAFPYLGLTPSAFGKISRSNPKIGVAILARITDKQTAEPYVQQLVEFYYTTAPDYCPTVVLAAAKAGLISSGQLSTYVQRAKAFSLSCANAKEKHDFLKAFFTNLHPICGGSSGSGSNGTSGGGGVSLDAGDKIIIGTLLNGVSELADVAKLWS